jgi:hypothetical protein
VYGDEVYLVCWVRRHICCIGRGYEASEAGYRKWPRVCAVLV